MSYLRDIQKAQVKHYNSVRQPFYGHRMVVLHLYLTNQLTYITGRARKVALKLTNLERRAQATSRNSVLSPAPYGDQHVR